MKEIAYVSRMDYYVHNGLSMSYQQRYTILTT
jgi:hypothetical protein